MAKLNILAVLLFCCTIVTAKVCQIGECAPRAGENCKKPNCETAEERNIFWSMEEPNYFWQCRLDSMTNLWSAEKFKCTEGLLFGFDQQRCVWRDKWIDQCNKTTGQEVICKKPTCETAKERNDFWPMPEPQFYWQCRTNSVTQQWEAIKFECPKGLYYGYDQKRCVWPYEWKNYCEDVITTEATTELTTAEESSISTESTEPTGESSISTEPTAPTVESSISTESTEPTGESSISTEPTSTDQPEVESTTNSGDPITPLPITCEMPACAIINDSQIAWPSRNSSEFWTCEYVLNSIWIPRSRRCPEDLFFAFSYQECVNSTLWTDECPDPSITFPPFTTANTPTEDPVTKPSNVNCGEPRCTSAGERSILWPSKKLDIFYECQWVDRLYQYIPVPISCAKNTLFDHVKQACVNPYEWDDYCGFINFPKLPIVCGQAHCNNDDEGAFKWPSNHPKSYIICKGEETFDEQCPEGFVFDVFEQDCVSKEDWRDICPSYPR